MTGDLGFTHRRRKDGSIEVLHHGRLAATLRGAQAARFSSSVQVLTAEQLQQSMARLTGNYKRGNEASSKLHPRNR
jgi:hypothetical protein